VHWDSGVTRGSVVGLSYDPMLAKLIVFAPTRELAITRMERALKELVVDGIETSREFHLRMMADEEFRRGDIDIQWLERRLPTLLAATPPAETLRAAAIAAALIAEEDRGAVKAGRETTASVPAQSAWGRVARLEALRRA
jgi:acetyl-CoA carboxylase biotin carboxylase subunit